MHKKIVFLIFILHSFKEFGSGQLTARIKKKKKKKSDFMIPFLNKTSGMPVRRFASLLDWCHGPTEAS